MERPIQVDVHFTSQFRLMPSKCQTALWPQWYSYLGYGHRQIPARLTEALEQMACPHQSKSAAGFGSEAIYIFWSTIMKYDYNGINNSINHEISTTTYLFSKIYPIRKNDKILLIKY